MKRHIFSCEQEQRGGRHLNLENFVAVITITHITQKIEFHSLAQMNKRDGTIDAVS